MSDIINRFFHSRTCVAVMMIITVIAAVTALDTGTAAVTAGNRGFAFPSPDEWFKPGAMAMWVNLLLNFAAAILLIWLNKIYNTMRSLSSLAASMFLLMQAGWPELITGFSGGTLTVIVLITVTMLLFSSYQSPGAERRVFLAMFILSLSALSLYSFLFYIPVVLIGMVQMKVFRARSVCAAVLGTITPVWILMGFGILKPDDFYMPHIVSVIGSTESLQLLVVASAALLTIGLGITFILMNFIKMLTYNSRIRAANGFLTVMLVFTIIFMLADFNNMEAYIPTLNWLAAYQAGHYFATSGNRRQYLGILSIIICYTAIYIWSLMI